MFFFVKGGGGVGEGSGPRFSNKITTLDRLVLKIIVRFLRRATFRYDSVCFLISSVAFILTSNNGTYIILYLIARKQINVALLSDLSIRLIGNSDYAFC